MPAPFQSPFAFSLEQDIVFNCWRTGLPGLLQSGPKWNLQMSFKVFFPVQLLKKLKWKASHITN